MSVTTNAPTLPLTTSAPILTTIAPAATITATTTDASTTVPVSAPGSPTTSSSTSSPSLSAIATTTNLASLSSPAQFIWKSSGDPARPIVHPFSLSVDTQGNIYVGNIDTSQVQKLDSDGHLLSVLGGPGQADGQFNFKASANATEVAIAVDQKDNLYVADLNYRVQKFDQQGKFLLKWGSKGKGDGQFEGPLGLVVDQQGNVYVSDIFNNVIQKFNSAGEFVTKWGSPGIGDGQFKKLANLALDKQGNVYATDNELNRVQKFDNSGKFLTQWGEKGQLDGAVGIVVDPRNNIYVSDKNSIVQFDKAGKILGRWGKSGSGDGEFNYPTSLALDKQGSIIYVADWMNNRIQKFQLR